MATWLHVPFVETPLSTYRTIASATALLALTAGPWWIRRSGGFAAAPVGRACAILLVAALVGARAMFVATHWSLFASAPLSAFRFWGGGRHVAGAIAVLLVAAPIVLRWSRLPAGRFADAGTPVVAAAVGLSRLGCFLHGCCAGRPSDVWWAVRYPADTGLFEVHRTLGLVHAGDAVSAPVHPLPLYFMGAAWGSALVTAWLVPRKRWDWQVVLTGVALFGVTTWLLEPFRMPPLGAGADGTTTLRSAALVLAVTGLAGLALGSVLHRIARTGS